jgi:hypothetical protein
VALVAEQLNTMPVSIAWTSPAALVSATPHAAEPQERANA